MEKLNIREIEQRLAKENDLHSPFVKMLEKDERKGVHGLLKKWHNKKDKEAKAYEKHVQMTCYEKKYRSEGFVHIAGVDEVGRGPLAGPVIAAAVILPPEFYLPGLDDSKKLSEQKRVEYYEEIIQSAIDYHVGIIDSEEIDKINIYEASKKAMRTAIAGLKLKPDFLLIDAVKLNTPYPEEAIIKGDSKSISIAAASIIAKVTRDRLMVDLGREYPVYGFSTNMGYGTKEHLSAIQMFGITSHHRKSFAPVKDYIGKRK
ncbi:ribonuclease HII [Bacillus sp. DTU_2020_1000418_1_SI_GHA_SEK_038]|uniref:ribonuclease HII n=1 Tax=Bacillus sp. DTU_2020_1000418_1_SI_GHA_SEK_038 TaxID=3077585 RepID=UPI0028E9E20D|nr:ribonuclease HII [Bacillus sp. DTU_2020_1000418_1_SI_GHA_SEK_038]WNS77156.1 ribonuclease HII [Bacillus sp. DTU_2020_1000418_1_SI_GHA_SEK_038]